MFKTTDSKIASQCETGSTFLGNSEPGSNKTDFAILLPVHANR